MSDFDDFDVQMLKNAMMGGFYFSETQKDSKPSKKKLSKRNQVLDLHFERLYPEWGHKAPQEKLELQLKELDQFIVKMKKSATRKSLVITGKGKGVLIKAVKKFLDERNVRYSVVFDPPYYGGAFTILL